jgi:hypothetical protein
VSRPARGSKPAWRKLNRKSAAALAIGIVGSLWILKNELAKNLVILGLGVIVGLRADIAMVDIGVLNTAVGIKGLRVYNPPGFHERLMLDLPEAYVNYKLLPLFAGRIHLQRVRVWLKEITVVKRADGTVNVQSVKAMQPGKATTSPEDKAQGGKAEQRAAKKEKEKHAPPGGPPAFRTDLMEVRIGRVVYKDYSKGNPPKVSTYELNYNEKFEKITNPYGLVALVLSRALVKTAVGKLAGMDIQKFEAGLKESLRESNKSLERFIERGEGRQMMRETGDAFEDAAKGIRNVFR